MSSTPLATDQPIAGQLPAREEPSPEEAFLAVLKALTTIAEQASMAAADMQIIMEHMPAEESES